MSPRAFQITDLPEDSSLIETTEVRVRYRDTDQMRHVYHSQYLVWFEMGRTEWLRSRGHAYREIEQSGVLLPVTELWTEYLRPAYYDDIIQIKSWIVEARKVSLRFGYEVHCEARKERLARAWTRHAYVNNEMRIVSPDKALLELTQNQCVK